jgi:hypothetical protein
VLKKSKGRRPHVPSKFASDQKSTPMSVREQEEAAGALLQSGGGARRRRGSGSNPNAKGDAVSFMDLGECKQRSAKSIRVDQLWLAKIEKEARAEGKMPFLHLRFLENDPHRVQRGMTLDWVILPAHAFQDLLEAARE